MQTFTYEATAVTVMHHSLKWNSCRLFYVKHHMQKTEVLQTKILNKAKCSRLRLLISCQDKSLPRGTSRRRDFKRTEEVIFGAE